MVVCALKNSAGVGVLLKIGDVQGSADFLPLVPYRQMVLSFPIPLRYWMQANRKLFAKVHRRVIRLHIVHRNGG